MTLEVLARAIRLLKEIKWMKTEKEEVKVSLLAGDMITNLSGPKEFIMQLQQLINNFNKVTEYNI